MKNRALFLAGAVTVLGACSDGNSVVGGDASSDTVIDTPSIDTPTVDIPSVDISTVDNPTVDVVLPPVDSGPTHCGNDSDCVGNPAGPACDVSSGACVACTPTSDHCPAGQYCVSGMNTCAAGCRDDNACMTATSDGGTGPARHCDTTTHACVECSSDAQCPAGTLCVGNTCVTGCNSSRPCPGTQSCCSGACIDTQSNTAHCGACGQQCMISNAAAVCMNGTCAVMSCNAPFADCDMTVGNGCETNLSNDTLHCGACRAACAPRPNTVATCAAGACAWACETGFSDCDGDAMNGCETDTRVSVNNCGACGMTCTLPNATAMCTASHCGVAMCATGYGDCDGVASNGCEANTLTSVSHCGACGRECMGAPNAVPACATGTCSITCTAGFADCDGDQANGCETDTRVSTNHCGACGRACALPHTTTSGCMASTCTVTVCATGYGDCDNTAMNGCETDTQTTVEHCGACGRACPSGQGCTSGVCTPLASCAAIHARFASAPSGVYTVDIDGAGATEAVQVYCDMTTEGGGWMLVYKLSSGVAGEPSAIWNGTGTNAGDSTLLGVTASARHYASGLLPRWNAGVTVTQARVGLYIAGTERAFLRFNGTGSNRTNWFTLARVQASTWTDLAAQGQNYFQIEGLGNYGRHWFINRNYGGCPADSGWLVVNGSSETTCAWSTRIPAVSTMFSAGTTVHNWNDYANVHVADVMAVFVR